MFGLFVKPSSYSKKIYSDLYYRIKTYLKDSLIITQPTNALIVCHLFLNHFLKHFHCSYMFR